MANIQRLTRKKLGEILLEAGVIDDLQLQTALTDQERSGALLGEILVDRGFVTEADIARTLACQFSLPYLRAEQIDVAQQPTSLLPLDLMREHLVMPLDRFGNCLTVLLAGLVSAEVLAKIEQQTGCDVQLFVGTASDVKALIKKIETAGKSKAGEPREAQTGHASLRPA